MNRTLVRVPVKPQLTKFYNLTEDKREETLVDHYLVALYPEAPDSKPLSDWAVELVPGKLWVYATPDLNIGAVTVNA